MVENLSVEQQILCSQLERYSPKIKSAYLGAIHALHEEDYEDRLVHFSHSLREVIDMLTKKNLPTEKKKKQLLRNDRITQLASVIDPAGRQTYRFDFRYEQLIDKYNKLVDSAHHRFDCKQDIAEKNLATVEEILSFLTKSQTAILDEIDGIISLEPSRDAAEKLKSYLFRWSSHSYLLEKLPCKWLQSLDEVNFFNNPKPIQSSNKQKSEAFPYWMPSEYLVKCSTSMQNDVTAIILKCEFKNSKERNPVIYNDFLKCALELSPDNMEKIAVKAIDEKWHDFLNSHFIIDKYTDLVVSLYCKRKLDVALKMLNHFFDHIKKEFNEHEYNYKIERILNEKIPKLAKKNPIEIAKLLASYIDNITTNDDRIKSHDMSYMLLKPIEDYEQNIHLLHKIPSISIVNLRNCLVVLGDTNPEDLKNNMNILSDKEFYIFRKLELFLYEKFPDFFKKEIEEASIKFFDVLQVKHEYYKLLKSRFGKIDKALQEKILKLINVGAKKIFEKYGKSTDVNLANIKCDEWTLKKLEPIHEYLDDKYKEQYDKLIEKLGSLPHPDRTEYMKTVIVQSTVESEFFSGKTVDEVFEIIKKHKPEENMMFNEDKTIASFEEFIKNNLLECSKKIPEIKNLDLKIQRVFLSAIETSVRTKKEIDWNSIITLIENYINSSSWDASSNPVFNHALELYRIIENGLREKQINYTFKNRMWNIVQKFITSANIYDDSDLRYKSDDTDSLTQSRNDVGGMSFHIFFGYIEWLYDENKLNDIFTDDIRNVLENYVNKKSGLHTISRHSAIGLYVPTLLHFDSKWTEKQILDKIFSSKKNKIAFWNSFVSFNSACENIMIVLHVLYNEFLNKSILNSMHEKYVYHSTIEHVILGYFYDIENFDKIFNSFISKADPASIRHCGLFITRILAENQDVLKFKDKIIILWKNQDFINHANLETWFIQKPFEKKNNIELFLYYMQNYTDKSIPVEFPLVKLDEYIDDFPNEVAQCIQIFVENRMIHHMSNSLKTMLKKLMNKKIELVSEICEKIINTLVTLGYNDYKDLLVRG